MRSQLVPRGQNFHAEFFHASAKIVQLLERVTVRRKAVSKQFHGEVLFATAGIFRIGDPACGDHKIFAQDFADVLKERRSDSFHHILPVSSLPLHIRVKNE